MSIHVKIVIFIVCVNLEKYSRYFFRIVRLQFRVENTNGNYK